MRKSTHRMYTNNQSPYICMCMCKLIYVHKCTQTIKVPHLYKFAAPRTKKGMNKNNIRLLGNVYMHSTHSAYARSSIRIHMRIYRRADSVYW